MSWFRKKNIKGKIYWYFVERVDNKEVQHYIGDDKAILNMISLHEVLCPGCKQRLALCGDGTYYCSQENKAYNLVVLLPNKKVSDREKVVKVSKGPRLKTPQGCRSKSIVPGTDKLPNKIHKLLPAGYKKYKKAESIINTICPGCGEKNCGEVWNTREKKSDPCTGESMCGKALLWHDWVHTKVGRNGEKYGFDYFYKLKKGKVITNAKYLNLTTVAGKVLNRWECPLCKADPDMPESRFNLSLKKDNVIHKCRFCKKELMLNK